MTFSTSAVSDQALHTGYPGVPGKKTAPVAVFFALSLLVGNYLTFSIFGVGGAVLVVSRIAVLLLLGLAFVKRPVVTPVVLYLLLACLVGVAFGGSENNIAQNLIFLVLTVCCLRHVALESVVDYSLVALFCALLLTFLLLAAGLTENGIDTADGRNRASFGFSNVNAFTSIVYAFVTLALFRWKQRPVLKYAVFSIVSYVVYLYTDSRSLVASIFVFVLAHGLFVATPRTLLKFISFALLFLPIVLTQLSSYIVQNYPLVDVVLSFRPSYSADFIKGFSEYTHIFGGVSPRLGQTIDNSFLLIQAAAGLPFLLGLSWLAFRRITEAINRNCPETFCLIMSFWSFSYSESSMVRPESIIGVVFWLILSKTISSRPPEVDAQS